MSKVPINIEDIEQLIVRLEAVTMQLREHTTRYYMEQAEELSEVIQEPSTIATCPHCHNKQPKPVQQTKTKVLLCCTSCKKYFYDK